MSAGGRRIEITFGASTHSKSKPMAPALSTGSSTAKTIQSMFGATPLLLENTKRAGGKKGLNG